MSHLLVIELPGGSDGDILARAFEDGHRVSFLSADPSHYLAQPDLAPLLEKCRRIIDAGAFCLEAVSPRLAAIHAADPFDAVLCLQDLRIVEAAQIARVLGLRHLDPAAAALARDKFALRQHLAAAGIAQPPARRVETPAALFAAIEAIGLPVLIKPADGFGSQNIFALRVPHDLEVLRRMPELIVAGPGCYGLGVRPRGGMLAERLLEGPLLGCDTLTSDGCHRLLGVNEKLFFPPPSFAIRGGCFSANCGQFEVIERYVFRLLDAIGFDHGAAHIELIVTADGPQLVEINPRLVGAGMARLLDLARGRSTHADLIALHLAGTLPPPAAMPHHAVSRWLSAPGSGTLRQIVLPPLAHGAGRVRLNTLPGQEIVPPLDNADRLGCVMTHGADRDVAEAAAEAIVAAARIEFDRAA